MPDIIVQCKTKLQTRQLNTVACIVGNCLFSKHESEYTVYVGFNRYFSNNYYMYLKRYFEILL